VAPRFSELQLTAGDFIPFLKTAFSMKRKTLLNNLKGSYSQQKIRMALETARLRADIRAEAVGLEQIASVFKSLQ
jgi:16S rRNA A1518/A1519 N6-dimethyltransferase RsmA/KsgA/DIM1 with predicted DNA glycosylase/AP lyase activity